MLANTNVIYTNNVLQTVNPYGLTAATTEQARYCIQNECDGYIIHVCMCISACWMVSVLLMGFQGNAC